MPFNRKFLIVPILLGSIAAIFYAIVFKYPEPPARAVDRKIERFQKIRMNMIGKEIHALKSIFGDSLYVREKKMVVLLYTGFDCGSCIDKGINIAQKIDSTFNRQYVFVIGSNADFGNLQFRAGYENFIYNDAKELIRKELKFIYTPVFLALNERKYVTDVYFPQTSGDESQMQKFLENLGVPH